MEVRAARGALELEQARDLRRSVLCGELHLSRDLVDDGLDPGDWLGLAWAGPKPVGTLRLRLQGSEAMVEHLAVLPGWRRQGVARALMAAAMQQTRILQVQTLWACGPEAAGPFFEAQGFNPTKREAGLVVWQSGTDL